MAAPLTYKLDPTATSTFGGTALPGAQSFTVNRTGEETLLSSDGNPFIGGAYYDNLSYTVTVELSENFKTAQIGDSGVLVLKAKARTNGKGVAVGVLTFTSGTAAALIKDVQHTVNHAGASSCTITFTIISVDGSTDGLTVA